MATRQQNHLGLISETTPIGSCLTYHEFGILANYIVIGNSTGDTAHDQIDFLMYFSN